MKCDYCGNTEKVFNGKCRACYVYFKKGGLIHTPPAKGEMKQDERGYYICHFCGKAFNRLGSHVREVHKMTIREYKEKFELRFNTRTTGEDYHLIMREYALENNMDKQLLEKGKNTRITGSRGSRRCSLQECKERSERTLRRYNGNKY